MRWVTVRRLEGPARGELIELMEGCTRWVESLEAQVGREFQWARLQVTAIIII